MLVRVRLENGRCQHMTLAYRAYLGQLVYTSRGERAVVVWYDGCNE
jgi:hypothetical protein